MTRRFVWLLAALLWFVLVQGSVVLAHAEVIGSSPASGSTVGGDIERIDIVFGDLVSNAVITVTGPDGVLDGEMVQTAGQVVAFGLDDKLKTEGQYKVEFEFDSLDDQDFVELEYAFTYDSDALEPLPVVAGARNERSGAGSIAIGVLAASTVALAGLLAWRYRKLARLRSEQ